MTGLRYAHSILLACLCASACDLDDDGPTDAPAFPTVYINEFLASNDASATDPDFADHADWIELHNGEATEVDLGGMYLTDDLEEPLKWQFPDGATLPSSGFLVVWADDEDTTLVAHHTNFKLGKGGEDIGLFSSDDTGNQPIDTISYEEQQTDVSYGRSPDGSQTWQTFASPTPGQMNR